MKTNTQEEENPPPLTKRCSQCGELKPLEGFHVCRDSKDGRRSKCKECARKYRRKYYEANAENIRAQSKKWREANRERRKEYDREYYKANAERRKEYVRKHREANPERGKGYSRKRRARERSVEHVPYTTQ